MSSKDFFNVNGHEIVIGSPPDYEELVAEIWINGECVAMLQKEEGDDKVIVEFFGEPIQTKVYYEVLLGALQDAKKALLR